VIPAALHRVVSDILDPQRLAGAIERTADLVTIAVGAWLALRLSRQVVRKAGAQPRAPAGRTFAPMVESVVRYAIVLAALVLMLQAVDVNVTAILASAGVAGLALGFGAQYLIRDILAGFFLLSEGIVQIGDTVRIDGDAGTVERVTLRTTQIRKVNGELLTIPNGAITRIGNLSRDFGRAIVQLTIPYRAEVPAAIEAVEQASRDWAAAHAQEALGTPIVDGIVDFRETGAVVQVSVRVRPGRQAAVEADLRRRALEALAQRGIRIDTRVSATI
jgi:small-conductance mechanosensitive channel